MKYQQEMKGIKISIITVCKNAELMIATTLESVISQTYSNIEYIIIDGASTDATLSVIEKATKKFPIKYISEMDEGIYDAMNKGIDLASGDYINFLNAGDILAEKEVISEVAAEIEKNPGDIYYGNIIYQYSNGESKIRTYGKICGKKIYYCTGDCINHQAIFAAAKCLKNFKFDTSYKICGDREWMMRMHKAGAVFRNMPLLICVYSLNENSVSLSNKELAHLEAARCIKVYFPMQYGIFCIFEACRANKIFAYILHKLYTWLYIRKK